MDMCPHCNRKYKTKLRLNLHVKGCRAKETHDRRVYTLPSSKSKVKLGCPVNDCNRKYSHTDRLKRHIETDHFYETRSRNYICFTYEIKSKIYKLASEYVKVLYKISKSDTPDEYGKYSAIKLLPHEKIDDNELARIVQAQVTFSKRLFQMCDLEKCDWERVIGDLESFFRLGLPYYDTNFCPTLLIDFLWHALMQNPELYSKVCEKSCGEIMPHCKIERSEDEDKARYEYFLRVFKKKYGDLYFPPAPERTRTPGDINKIQETLAKLSLQEETKRLEKIEKIEKEEERRLEEYKIKRKKELEEMRLFSKKANVNVNDYWDYETYYLHYYQQGLVGEQLEKYVLDEKYRIEHSYDSKC